MLTQARHEIGRDSYLRSRLVQCSLGGDLIMTGNAAHWFVDRHIAEGRGAKPAFEEAWDGGRQLTYGALAEGTGKVADALMRSAIPREARAAMFVLDQIEFPLFSGVRSRPAWCRLHSTHYCRARFIAPFYTTAGLRLPLSHKSSGTWLGQRFKPHHICARLW